MSQNRILDSLSQSIDSAKQNPNCHMNYLKVFVTEQNFSLQKNTITTYTVKTSNSGVQTQITMKSHKTKYTNISWKSQTRAEKVIN